MSDLLLTAFRQAMRPPAPCALAVSRLSEIYPTTKQNLFRIIRKYGLSRDYIADPHALHATLTVFGNDSQLRRALDDFKFREELARKIADANTILTKQNEDL